MDNNNQNSGLIVHQVLAISYAVYLVSICLGLVVSQFWDIKLSDMSFEIFGFILILFGTFLSFWAQYVSGVSSKKRNDAKDTLTHEHFLIGPYTITRSPTQYGLLFMALGLAFLYSSLVMVLTTLIAFLLGKFVFIPLEEKHLEEKYGTPYQEYKQKVRF